MLDRRIFSGNRLRNARESRGTTGSELAKYLGVSKTMVAKYEGKRSLPPALDKLQMISEYLRYPQNYFFGEDLEDIPQKAITFRSQRSTTATLKKRVVARTRHASCLVSPAFRSRFRLPDLDLPDLAGDTPENAAKLLRDHWKLGESPIKSIIHLVEAKGIELYWLAEQSQFVDAVSFWRDNRAFICLNTFKSAGERENFDCAHELGHLVMHRYVDAFDAQAIETEAHAFAAAFLLPAGQFKVECPRSSDYRKYMPLKRRWRASIQAIVRRGFQLKLITQYQYEQIFKDLAWQRLRTHEPEELPREESGIHTMIYHKLFQVGVTPDIIAEELHLSLTDLIELTPAARKFADQNTLRIGQLLIDF